MSEHIFIIGGSSGIGLATAGSLLRKGHRVTIGGRDRSRLERAKDGVSGDLRMLAMNAADPAGLPSAFSEVGEFDHLVLALGSGKGAGPFASVSIDDVKAGFEEKV